MLLTSLFKDINLIETTIGKDLTQVNEYSIYLEINLQKKNNGK